MMKFKNIILRGFLYSLGCSILQSCFFIFFSVSSFGQISISDNAEVRLSDSTFINVKIKHTDRNVEPVIVYVSEGTVITGEYYSNISIEKVKNKLAKKSLPSLKEKKIELEEPKLPPSKIKACNYVVLTNLVNSFFTTTKSKASIVISPRTESHKYFIIRDLVNESENEVDPINNKNIYCVISFICKKYKHYKTKRGPPSSFAKMPKYLLNGLA